MSELSDLSMPVSAESIPPALAAAPEKTTLGAPRGGKRKGVKLSNAEPFVSAPATFPDETIPALPTAAASAEPQNEEKTMATTFENAATTATDKTQAMLGDMSSRAKGAMEKSAAMAAELNGFTKGNVEALVESGKIAVAGMQTLAQDQAAYVRKQFEEATAAARTMASVKSPTEFVKLQGDYVRQQFDGMVANASRSTEAMLKLAGEVVQPLSNRWALAAERVKQAA